MRRGWLTVVLLVACAVASPAPLRAEAEKKADGKDDKSAKELRDKYANKSAEELKTDLKEAVDHKHYREAGFILDTLRTKHGEASEDVLKELSAEVSAPQKGVFGFTIDLAIWTAVVFLVMLLLLWKFAWGPLLQGLEAREKSIHSAVEDARAAREEAQRLQAQMQAEMAKAGEQARALVEEATKRAAE